MNNLTPLLNWWHLFYAFLIVASVYGLARILERRLNRGLYLRDADGPVRAFVRIFMVIINPLATVILVAIFIAINPFIHGLIVLFIVLFGFSHIQNYVSGKVLKFDREIRMGRELSSQSGSGKIVYFGLTGLYLQADNRQQRVAYVELLKQGYSLEGDSTRGGYFRLALKPVAVLKTGNTEGEEGTEEVNVNAQQERQKLQRLLIDNPYIKTGFSVSDMSTEEAFTLGIDVGLHQTEQLEHFVALLEEAGYEVSNLT